MAEKNPGILQILHRLGNRRSPSVPTPDLHTQTVIMEPLQSLKQESSERLFGEPKINTVYQGIAVKGKQGVREALRAYAVFFYRQSSLASEGMFTDGSIVNDSNLTLLEILNYENRGQTLDFIERYLREVDSLETKSQKRLQRLHLISQYDQRSLLQLQFEDRTTETTVQEKQGLGIVAAPFLLNAFDLHKQVNGRERLRGIYDYDYLLRLPNNWYGVDTSEQVYDLLRTHNIAVERPVREVDVNMPITCKGDIFELDIQDITRKLALEPSLFDTVDPVTLAGDLAKFGEHTLKRGNNFDIRIKITQAQESSNKGSNVFGKRAEYTAEKAHPQLQIAIIPTHTEFPDNGTLDSNSIENANWLATRIRTVFA